MKCIAPLIIGGVAGAAVTFALLSLGPDPSSTARDAGPRVDAVSPVERFEIYLAAAGLDDPDALMQALRRLARTTPSRARDLQIDAGLARLVELDPAAAARVALELDDDRFVTVVYRDWAERDPDAALSSMASIEHAAMRREVSLALLDVAGDALPYERLAAAVPVRERASLDVERLGRHAADDPSRALRDALRLTDTVVQTQALQRIAVEWAALDPIGALDHAAWLPSVVQAEFRQRISLEWARLDPEGFLHHMEFLSDPEQIGVGVTLVIAADPERVIAMTERMSGDFALSLRSAAAFGLAERDPLTMIAQVEAMPAGPERRQMLEAAAAAYARRDPQAALAWVSALTPPQPDVQMTVIGNLAASDASQWAGIVDTALRLPGANPSSTLALLAGQMSRDPAQAPMFAELLLARNDSDGDAALARLVPGWARQDPDAVAGWVVAHAAQLDAPRVRDLAGALAGVDAETAIALADQLSPELRAAAVPGIAGAYARLDPAAALAWIAPLRGQVGYNAALEQIVTQRARTDPAAAAGMLEGVDAEVVRAAATAIARGWTQRAPDAAAHWASSLGDEQARSSAVGNVAVTWARQDVDAAAQWALTLPNEASRERALSMLLLNTGTAGEQAVSRARERIGTEAID